MKLSALRTPSRDCPQSAKYEAPAGQVDMARVFMSFGASIATIAIKELVEPLLDKVSFHVVLHDEF